MTDKLMYFLAGLAIGLLQRSKEEKQEPSPNAFVPFPVSAIQQIQQMQEMGQHAAQAAAQTPPPVQPPPSTHRCTFKCWLCAGTTTFQYPGQPAQQQFQVECSRCGIENLVKIPAQT